MIRETLGITHIKKLYVGLHFGCRLRCSHCYHGKRLLWPDHFTLDQAKELIYKFRNEFGILEVILTGGEPFLWWPQLVELLGFIKNNSIRTTICTSGYQITDKLPVIANILDSIRISLEGMEETHDQIRCPGSFSEAMNVIGLAKRIGIPTSATVTINSINYKDIIPLIRELLRLDIERIDIHCMRRVGYGLSNQELAFVSDEQIAEVESLLLSSPFISDAVKFEDEVVHNQCESGNFGMIARSGIAERLMIEANGEIYLSCSALGTGNASFLYDKISGSISYRGSQEIEFSRQNLIFRR